MSARQCLLYAGSQAVGAIVGVMLGHAMFEQSTVSVSLLVKQDSVYVDCLDCSNVADILERIG